MSGMPTYEVLSYTDLEQRRKWRDICQRYSDLDIYYYPEYVYLFELNGDGKAHCYVYYESPIDIVLYPFLKRCINDLEIFADIPLNISDITTPYGYGGYFRTSDLVDMEKFYESFKAYCRQNQIVSEFIRFNPILKNQVYSPKDVQIRQRNETVVMDLTQPLDDLWMGMAPSCRNKIRKSKNYGVDIVIDHDASNLGTFYSIYCKTMERLGSQDYYYFPLTWFESMLSLLNEHLVLFHALYRNSTIMSAIFLFTKDIIHYFLSGSIYEMRNLASNNLMIYEVALWAQKQGIKYFHLGGGYLPNDNLFKFKASFSSFHSPFCTGEAIHDRKLYRELNRRRWGPLGLKETHFFPTYRTPVKDHPKPGLYRMRPFYKVLAYEDPQDRQEWQALCELFKEIDIYFYPEFSYLCQLNGDGQAFCFVYFESPGNVVIYPFLVRRINELTPFNNFSDNLIDITSPYGYGGYLRSSDQVDMDRFYTTFKQYCQENNVISEFIRFHPMLNNHYYCPKDIEIEFWNETVAIDLTKDETEIFRDMEYNCQKAIRQAHNNNVIIQKDEDFRYLDDFYDIYIKTMTRVNANDYYLFPRKWFDAVIELLAGNLSLFHAFYQDSIIASVLFLHSGPFLHAHLGGSIHEMRHLRPNNLLLYQVALWGKKCGFKIFHLGGGLKHNDNLFKYKASFSPIRMNFYIGKVIHNYELYKSLTDLKSDFEGDNPLDAHYFPEYRPPKAISSRRPFYKGISSIRPFYKVLAYEDPQDRQEWHTLCESFKEIDIYFYPEFSYLCQLHGDGQAFCFVYFESPGNVVIYPFLARRINELTTFNNCPDNLIDITSPYGYGGYLRSSDQVDMDRFYTTFKQYCQDNNVISEFVRFHPLLNNHYYCPKDIKIEVWNETVAIDLTKDESEIFLDMYYNCRYNVRKAIKSGVIIQIDEDFRHLDDFYDIYIKTMTRVNAHDYYFFTRKWFYDAARLLSGNLSLFHAVYQDSIIASGLFMHSGPFVHAHLGGSIYEMRHLRANNLLLYQVALWAKKCGFKIYHLGGGVNPKDDLFKFKASFSPIRMNYYIGKAIHDHEFYKSLTDLRSDSEDGNPLGGLYFPEYRPPILN